MRTIKVVSYFIVTLFLGMTFNSCEGEAGPAGQDGNANVHTYVYNSPSWDDTNSSMYIDMSSVLTNDIVANDVILGYVKNTNVSTVFAIPGNVWAGSNYRNYTMIINGSPSTYTTFSELSIAIVSLELDGSFTPHPNLQEMDWFKCIIIDSSNTTTGRSSLTAKQQIYSELENANVDVNDYYAVCAYYGINP